METLIKWQCDLSTALQAAKYIANDVPNMEVVLGTQV